MSYPTKTLKGSGGRLKVHIASYHSLKEAESDSLSNKPNPLRQFNAKLLLCQIKVTVF